MSGFCKEFLNKVMSREGRGHRERGREIKGEARETRVCVSKNVRFGLLIGLLEAWSTPRLGSVEGLARWCRPTGRPANQPTYSTLQLLRLRQS